MLTNATVTLTRRGEGYDQTTGRKEAAETETLLQDEPCAFHQQESTSRQSFSNGQRELVKPVYSILIPMALGVSPLTIEIAPGDQATVTQSIGANSLTRTFTVTDAVMVKGVAEAHWECAIEKIKVAIPPDGEG